MENTTKKAKQNTINKENKERFVYKMLPIIGVIPFPNSITRCIVGTSSSINAVRECMKNGQDIFVAPKQMVKTDHKVQESINYIGTICKIEEFNDNDGEKTLKLKGVVRASISQIVQTEPFFMSDIKIIVPTNNNTPKSKKLFDEICQMLTKENSNIENLMSLNFENLDANFFIDSFASAFVKDERSQLALLNELDTEKRLELFKDIIEEQIEIANLDKSIKEKVRNNMDKNQKEYYLREQMRAISDELGDGEDEYEQIEKTIESLPLNEEVREKANKELSRLRKIPVASPDNSVIRNYLDTLLSLPWGKKTEDNKDLELAKKILEEDHAGLEVVKKRILEHLAVMQLTNKVSGEIICFVGPPGVGKTSIAKSIARALNRNFVKMSVGGVKDESEIRGHRKTYVGAMCGRIITNIKLAKSVNPVFLIDEIDKMSSDYKADPTSAMLEVLDSEQNFGFRDHFLEVPFDLSDCMFIATANNIENIPAPLLDRMEVIELSSYTSGEKKVIATKFLLPKNIEKHGFKPENLVITSAAMDQIINEYTFEAGVRNLERQIASVCRKVAMKMVTEKNISYPIIVDTNNLQEYLGAPKVKKEEKRKEPEIGVITGLSYSSIGGGILHIEVNAIEGEGKIVLTGNLGDVMKESAQVAVSIIKRIAPKHNIDIQKLLKSDIHIHAPENAVKKEGPSAGVALATAIYSVFANKKIDNDLAITGEVTIKGNILAIGGLKEKLFAAVRAGISKVIIPLENKKDIAELPKEIVDSLAINFASTLEDVLKIAIID